MKLIEYIKEYKKKNKNYQTLLISAFPGCGKSYLFNHPDGLKILDSDSSKFDKNNFPENYIQHIKENIDKADIILISSHEDVRKALVENNLSFLLVFPKINLKNEYLKRYEERGSPESFIKLLNNNWDNWITDCDNQDKCLKYQLSKGEFLSDINIK